MILQKITKILLASTLLFSSCSKKDDQAPEISFEQPSMSMYAIGATVPLQLHIEDNEELHGVDIHITNEANSEMIMMSWEHIHEGHIMIDTSFVANLDGVMMTNFTIHVEAKDVSGNKADASKSVHIMGM
tara:strand:- start:44 stop:433 length:390 start_codon:yes stop_codon:yes gene_type:complete